MEEILNDFLVKFLELASAFVLSVIGICFVKIRKYIVSKTENQLLESVLLDLSEKGEEVVIELEHTLVKELKAKTEDGKLSKDDIKEINHAAFNMMMNRLSTRTIDFIEDNSDDIEDYILGKIKSTNGTFKRILEN